MVNPYRFYTYAYLRVDRTPYYIGKGTGKRVYKKEKGEAIKPPKDKSRILFLKQHLTEEEAFKHEIYMIAVFGRKDLGTGILHNRTDGGEGNSGRIHSKESRMKISKNAKNKNKNKKWWNNSSGDNKFSIDCPGKGWTLGMSEETKSKMSEVHSGENHPNYGKTGKNHPSYGKRWWSDENGNNKLSAECPGQNWVQGMSEEVKIKMSKLNKGKNKNKKCWNDGFGNSKKSVECPGEGWVLGMTEENRTKTSEAKRGENNPAYGKKWWNDGNGNIKFSKECPGEGWVPGRGKLRIS